jgi:hypothetical protein
VTSIETSLHLEHIARDECVTPLKASNVQLPIGHLADRESSGRVVLEKPRRM